MPLLFVSEELFNFTKSFGEEKKKKRKREKEGEEEKENTLRWSMTAISYNFVLISNPFNEFSYFYD